jgi:hypothetical protein
MSLAQVCICLTDLSLNGPQQVGEDISVSGDVRIAGEVVLLVESSRRAGYLLRMQVGGQAQQVSSLTMECIRQVERALVQDLRVADAKDAPWTR